MKPLCEYSHYSFHRRNCPALSLTHLETSCNLSQNLQGNCTDSWGVNWQPPPRTILKETDRWKGLIKSLNNQRHDDWDDLLPFTEFQYNNHIHSATQNVPFFLDTGWIPHIGFELDQHQSHVESVNKFKERMEDALNEAKVALVKSKDDMAKYYDQRRTPALEYQPGDWVYLDTSNIHTTRPSQKLSHQRLGPFLVIRKVGNGTYCLCLPPSMSRLHPVFNIVKLTLAPEDPVPG